MKMLSNEKKWTTLAAGSYSLLTIFELFRMRGLIGEVQLSVAGLPLGWFIELSTILLFAGMALFATSREKGVKQGTARAVVLGTALLLVYVLFTYQMQGEIVFYSFQNSFPSISDSKIWQYVFVIVKLLLLILGAFFLVVSSDSNGSSDKEEKEANEEKEEEEADEVEVTAEIVEEMENIADDEVVEEALK